MLFDHSASHLSSSPLPISIVSIYASIAVKLLWNLTSAYYEVNIILPSVLMGEVEAVSEKSKQTFPQQGAQWHIGVQLESLKISLSYVLLVGTDLNNCLEDKLYCMSFAFALLAFFFSDAYGGHLAPPLSLEGRYYCWYWGAGHRIHQVRGMCHVITDFPRCHKQLA